MTDTALYLSVDQLIPSASATPSFRQENRSPQTGGPLMALVFCDGDFPDDTGVSEAPALSLTLRDIEIRVRGLSVWARCPDDQKETVVEAIGGYHAASQSLHALEQAQVQEELALLGPPRAIPSLKAAVTASMIRGWHCLALQRFLTRPAAATGGGKGLSVRLRTELAAQALLHDRLDLLEEHQALLDETLQNRLTEAQEQRRTRVETVIGLTIIVLLLLDFGISIFFE